MSEKDEIVREFAKYCSKCDGQCCKQGVFTVFGWEMEKLSSEYADFHVGYVSDQRGKACDISINNLCQFSTGHGCKLPVELRATDCLTYPFYPKLKKKNAKLNIDCFVIQKECPFHEKIAGDRKLLKLVHSYWEGMIDKVSNDEITDWVGADGRWHEWYKNSVTVNCSSKSRILSVQKQAIPAKVKDLAPAKLRLSLNIKTGKITGQKTQ